MTGRQVNREEWLRVIQTRPDRISDRTGICEPPQEICYVPLPTSVKPIQDWVVLARVIYPADAPKEFWVYDEHAGSRGNDK